MGVLAPSAPNTSPTSARELSAIEAVLPVARREELEASGLLVWPGGGDGADMTVVRRAIRLERKVEIGYRDLAEARSSRTIWPIALIMVSCCWIRGHCAAQPITSRSPLPIAGCCWAPTMPCCAPPIAS